MTPVDEIQLNFSPAGLTVLNVILGLVMFGVALDLRTEDFKRVVRLPRAPLIGLVAQFLLLPAVTFGLTQLIDPIPSIALGMIMVAACPGGNISNFIAHIAGGNAVLSISMTAISTVGAIVMTPFNLALWGGMDPETDAILTAVALDPVRMFATIFLILGLPLALGMTLAAKRPALATRLRKPFKVSSLLFFGAFVAIALAVNFGHFLNYVGFVAVAVAVHNATALALGYGSARLLGLPPFDARAIAVEVGIQNSGLALILIFTFFGGLGGMALVAAWWGVWHVIAGLSLAWFWSRRPVPHPLEAAA